MKKIFLLSLITFICSFIFVNTSFSQDLSEAQVTSELYITLDYTASPDTRVFEADIEKFNFQDIAAADRFFSFFNENTVTFDVDIVTRKVLITLVTSTERQDWTITDWQTYLKNKIAEQRNQLGIIDFTTR